MLHTQLVPHPWTPINARPPDLTADCFVVFRLRSQALDSPQHPATITLSPTFLTWNKASRIRCIVDPLLLNWLACTHLSKLTGMATYFTSGLPYFEQSPPQDNGISSCWFIRQCTLHDETINIEQGPPQDNGLASCWFIQQCTLQHASRRNKQHWNKTRVAAPNNNDKTWTLDLYFYTRLHWHFCNIFILYSY